MREIEVLILNNNVQERLTRGLEAALVRALPVVQHTTAVPLRSLPSKCFNARRQQYDAEYILDDVLEQYKSSGSRPAREPASSDQKSDHSHKTLVLLVTSEDCYHEPLNFVFGLARGGEGCLVSTSRLGDDRNFVVKECVHEMGHVFGLKHCRLPCVMTFSNSVPEAHQKSIGFCGSCSSKLAANAAKYGS